jgi:hypothetical protein
MTRKAQVVAIREIMHFGFGIMLLISVILLFNNLKPIVENYALQRQVDNINSHVNYLLTPFIRLSSELESGFVKGTYPLPNELGDYDYVVFFEDNYLCTKITVSSINSCLTLDNNSAVFSGRYTSGGELNIVLNLTSTDSLISLSN